MSVGNWRLVSLNPVTNSASISDAKFTGRQHSCARLSLQALGDRHTAAESLPTICPGSCDLSANKPQHHVHGGNEYHLPPNHHTCCSTTNSGILCPDVCMSQHHRCHWAAPPYPTLHACLNCCWFTSSGTCVWYPAAAAVVVPSCRHSPSHPSCLPACCQQAPSWPLPSAAAAPLTGCPKGVQP